MPNRLNQRLRQRAEQAAKILHDELDSKGLQKIVLYGSVAENRGTRRSDIDLALVRNKPGGLDPQEIASLRGKFDASGLTFDSRDGGIHTQFMDEKTFKEDTSQYAKKVRKGKEL